MSEKKTKAQLLARDQKLIAGAQAHLGSAQLLILGTEMTGPSFVTLLQGRVASATKVVTTKAAWTAAVKADEASELASAPTVSAAIEAIYAAYGNAADTLADFGLAPRKVPTMTTAQRIAAQEKARATRAARHTMGSKQKAAITGTVPAAPSASAPVAPTAPALTPTTK